MKVILALPLGNPYKRELPEIALGYLASVLREHGHEVKLLRGMRTMDPEAFARVVREFKPDIFGMRFLSPSYGAILQSARFLKRLDPSITLLVGGPHPTGEPVGTLTEMLDVDYAFSGEAEIGLPMFMERLAQYGPDMMATQDLSDVPGLIWRNDGAVKVNPVGRVENLDEIPFPAWDLMEPSSYPADSHSGTYRAAPVAPIVMTRGCPYLCTFCAPVNGRSVRYRTPANVVEEMLMLQRDYGVKEIDVYDSNCAFSKKFLLAVCNLLIEADSGLYWSANNGVRLGSLDEELLAAMRRSGCYQVAVGIETGSPEMLKRIKKGVTVKRIREKTAMIRKAGINAHGFFIFGLPGETRAQMQETIDLALELPLTRANFSIFNPLPGTDLYDEVKAQGKLEGVDWSTLNYAQFKSNFSELAPDELIRLERKTFLKFHLRPRIVWHMLQDFSLPTLLKAVWKAFRSRFLGGSEAGNTQAAEIAFEPAVAVAEPRKATP